MTQNNSLETMSNDSDFNIEPNEENLREISLEDFSFDYDWEKLNFIRDDKKEFYNDTMLGYKKICFENKINPETAKNIFEYFNKKNIESIDLDINYKNSIEESVNKSLVEEYGEKFTKKLDYFNQGIEDIFKDCEINYRESMKNFGLLDSSKQFFKHFVKIGESKVNTTIGVNNKISFRSMEELDAENLLLYKSDAFKNQSHPDHIKTKNKYNKNKEEILKNRNK